MFFLAANIGDCPHTEGLYKASRIAGMGGIESFVCQANSSREDIIQKVKEFEPDYIGFSYRLSPQKGIDELRQMLNLLYFHGLLDKPNGEKRKIAYAGLPETINILVNNPKDFPVEVYPIVQVRDPHQQIENVFNFFSFGHTIRKKILSELNDELNPPRIEMLDQLADEVMYNDNYQLTPPLPIPSDKARVNYIQRMSESDYPMLRSHFGIPSESIEPTVEGIRRIAEARVIDEVSIGSSDLSQRYYGNLKEFLSRKNDGGVPYKDKIDLARLFQASRTGNYPSCKPYAHTTGILDFIDDCISTGHLTGAHQAVPLFWFNQLDGRGSTPVKESIAEHIAAVRKLAGLGLPVEMNDPNQWSSRWAHDTIVVADYAIISSVMLENGVNDLIFQMQFNKPVETSDYGDLAKMKSAAQIIRQMKEQSGRDVNIYHETRTGIEYFSPELSHARWQLARSTLLQMFLSPSVIHLVSYCEAVRAATVEDIIESSKIIRRAVDVFRKHEFDLRKYESDMLVQERMGFLLDEADYLIKEVASLHNAYTPGKPITKYLSDPDIIYKSIENGLMAAPGIVNPQFKNERLVTKPMKNGFFNAIDFDSGSLLSEKERISQLNH